MATIESVGSSTRIEGAKLSDVEVEALFGRIKTDAFATRDEQEVAGYARVMETVFESFETIQITENYLKQLHAMLLQYSDKDSRHRGIYKKHSNCVEAFDQKGQTLGVVFETSSPFDTPRGMKELFDWYKESQLEHSQHPLIIVGIFIVVFLAIHPFQDGNGRLSRILTTLLLLQAGYVYVPYSSLESVIEESKDGYYLALRRTQATLNNESHAQEQSGSELSKTCNEDLPAEPDWVPWLTFFLRALQKQIVRLKVKVEREHLMRESMSELARTIFELTVEHGTISVSEVVVITGSARGTIKKNLATLVNQGHLKLVGRGRASRYIVA